MMSLKFDERDEFEGEEEKKVYFILNIIQQSEDSVSVEDMRDRFNRLNQFTRQPSDDSAIDISSNYSELNEVSDVNSQCSSKSTDDEIDLRMSPEISKRLSVQKGFIERG